MHSVAGGKGAILLLVTLCLNVGETTSFVGAPMTSLSVLATSSSPACRGMARADAGAVGDDPSLLMDDILRGNATAARASVDMLMAVRGTEKLEQYLGDMLPPEKNSFPLWARMPLTRYSRRARALRLRKLLELSAPTISSEPESDEKEDEESEKRRAPSALFILLRSIANNPEFTEYLGDMLPPVKNNFPLWARVPLTRYSRRARALRWRKVLELSAPTISSEHGSDKKEDEESKKRRARNALFVLLRSIANNPEFTGVSSLLFVARRDAKNEHISSEELLKRTSDLETDKYEVLALSETGGLEVMHASTVIGEEEDRSVPALQPELCCTDKDAAGQEDEENPTRSLFPAWMIPLVSEVSPLPWMILNNAIAVSGCLLIADLWYINSDYGDLADRPLATAFFLCWEFFGCAAWMLETGLDASYQRSYLGQPLKWYTQSELAVAVCFVGFTFRTLWQWDLLQYDENVIWEIVFDTSFYVYLAVRSFQRTSEPSELLPNRANQPDISSSILEEPVEGEQPGSYRIMAKYVGTTNNTGVLVS